MPKILILNGPNLNLLGSREPAVYGSASLGDVEAMLLQQALGLGAELDFLQSNHEGVLIDRIHAARLDGTAFIIINPGGLTHTSVSLRDALSGVAIPFVEVHISNVHKREAFRHRSYLSAVAEGVVAGFGIGGYSAALRFACERLHGNS